MNFEFIETINVMITSLLTGMTGVLLRPLEKLFQLEQTSIMLKNSGEKSRINLI